MTTPAADAPPPAPSTRADFDKIPCHVHGPGCQDKIEMILMVPMCHPGPTSVRAVYTTADGVLTLVCPECGVRVARIQVAWAVPS